jgi:tripartite-type tricarboxylate transporter receptor subunit TctC
MRAAGVRDYEARSWWGIVAPSGTPPDIVEAPNNEINKALSTEQMIKFLTSEGAEAAPGTPRQFGELITSEIARWLKVAHDADIHAD